MLVALWIRWLGLSSIFIKRERFLYPRAAQLLSDKETAPDMGDDSMCMSLLNVTPVERLDFDRWGFP